MRELVMSMFLSLDGVMQAPGGPEEDAADGFALGGWAVPYWDEALDAFMGEFMTAPFDLVLGRKTYDIFAGYWPQATEDGAEELNAATKYVASRGRTTLSWDRSVLIEGDVVEGIAALKREDGPELQVHGSGNLLQTLLRHGLVDRFRLLTFPVTLGSGKRLFAEGTAPAALRLLSSTVSSTGVVMSAYEPAGDVATGSFPAE